MGKDTIEGAIQKYKDRIKKVCCCGFCWLFFGVCAFISGIALVILFAGYINDENNKTKAGYAYTGIAFLIVGLLLLTVGIVLCVALRILYMRMSGRDLSKTQFRPPTYGPGEAPYPQQPNGAPCYGETGYTKLDNQEPHHDAQPPPAHPSAPEKPPMDAGDVHVDVEDHNRY